MVKPTVPNLADPAERRRLSASAVRAFLNIVQKWELTEDHARALLGGVASSTYDAWKADPGSASLDQDTMTRISRLIGIFKALNICYGKRLADQWVRLKNTGPLFAGQPPIDFMILRGQAGMAEVQRLLDSRMIGNR